MTEKKYKIKAPIGNIIIPKETMTEKEVREFSMQIIQDPEFLDIWKEKIEKDGIKSVVDWLKNSGYLITEI